MTTISMTEIDVHHKSLAMASLQWMHAFWEHEQQLLRSDVHRPWDKQSDAVWYDVRGTIRYAIGLLLRGEHGDLDRAQQAIAGVLGNQILAPGHVTHGTFARTPDEIDQPETPRIWVDYDPNWREFIGCSLTLILKHFSAVLDAELVGKIEQALRHAVEGSVVRAVSPFYTNIALMSAYLCNFAGDYFNSEEWFAYGEQLGVQIYDIYKQTDTFEEYNSPTYYGVDFVALAFWRSAAPSHLLRRYGAEMEDGLWQEVGSFYHAGLKNMSGPYVRSYGMDMQAYLASVTLWIWAGMGEDYAPHPDMDSGKHTHDFTVGPAIALLGAQIPDTVQQVLQVFPGERFIERTITSDPCIVSSWQNETCMLGGIYGKKYVAPQLHAATAHWLAPNGQLCHLRFHLMQGDNLLRSQSARVHASASQGALVIQTHEYAPNRSFLDGVFHIHAPGVELHHIQSQRWQLPGMTFDVEFHGAAPVVSQVDDGFEIRFHADASDAMAAMHFKLHCTLA